MATTRTYLAECYSPGIDRQSVRSSGERATAAAAGLQHQGIKVKYLGAILVPEDEVVFYLFAANSLGAVREASTRAGVEFERVLESLPVGINQMCHLADRRGGFPELPTQANPIPRQEGERK